MNLKKEVRIFMDRIQAQTNIGKNVIINEGKDGKYVGILQEIISEPRKTWRAIVSIVSVYELPEFISDNQQVKIKPLKYNENEVIECIGTKIDSIEEEIFDSFNGSLITASQKKWTDIKDMLSMATEQQEALQTFLYDYGFDLRFEDPSDENNEENPLISFVFQKKGKRYLLFDENNKHMQLDLENCPFEFQWYDVEHQIGFYEGNGTFISSEGNEYRPKNGDILTLNKDQFEPYQILQNELEQGSFESLEKSLQSFGLSHENIEFCHNALLQQLLQATAERSFKGVNFLTYRGDRGVVTVQHHFERTINENADDEIYDRFEFTTDQGERSIVTYTNAFSK